MWLFLCTDADPPGGSRVSQGLPPMGGLALYAVGSEGWQKEQPLGTQGLLGKLSLRHWGFVTLVGDSWQKGREHVAIVSRRPSKTGRRWTVIALA